MNLRISSVLSLLLLSLSHLGTRTGLSAEAAKPLNFEEVYSIIKTNLSDLPQSDLSRLAAEGLVNELGPNVELITTNGISDEQIAEPIPRKTIYNESFAYLRLARIQSNTPALFQKELKDLGLNKKLKGVVIDLRYSGGQDYSAAAELAGKFVPSGVLLAKIGDRELRSAENKQRSDLPVVILVNHETKGASEALAGMMRGHDAALIIGQRTAGEARLFQTFPLSTGQKLRIGTIPVELEDGKEIPESGLVPDISVTIGPELEKALYKDPYHRFDLASAQANLGTNDLDRATNTFSRADRAVPTRRFNEAELVRRHNEGVPLDAPDDFAPVEPQTPVMADPVLGRALDFLKGLSVLQLHRD